jgi:hypothetical protein
MVCGILTTDSSSAYRYGHETLVQGMRWASVVSLMAGVYYFMYKLFHRCYRKKPQQHHSANLVRPITIYRDLPQYTPRSTSDTSYSSDETVLSFSPSVIPPELTTENVWVHVYGWGILIFVSAYCLPGIYMPGSCWWSFGMLVLCIDELIATDVNRKFVFVIGVTLIVSIVSVWWGVVGMDAKDQTLSEIFVGVSGPALVPFIFFSVRSSVRDSVRDIPRIFEFAAPFVLVLSVFVLATTQRGELSLRRRLEDFDNITSTSTSTTSTAFTETHAAFIHDNETLQNFTNLFSQEVLKLHDWKRDILSFAPFTALCLSPFFSGLVMYLATSCVINGYATEFAVAFVLNMSGKFSVERGYDTTSAIAFFPAALALVLLLILRKVF